MNPIEVVVKLSGKCVGHACGACRSLHLSESSDEDSLKQAEACCAPKVCAVCDGPGARQYGCGVGTEYRVEFLCDACRDKVWAKEREERQTKALEKAKKVHVNDWPHPVFWPGRDADNGFFDSIESLLDACEDDDCDLPPFVWGSTKKTLSLDADGIIESALEDHHEGAGVEPSEIERLQAMLDAWCDGQKVTSYDEDQSIAIVLKSS